MQKFSIYLMIIFLVSLAAAQPPSLPFVVNGTVEIDGELAPIGTLVTAEMDGETVDYELTEPGEYALSIPGTLGDYWKEVKFYVDGIPMEQTAKWKAGDIVNIDFNISEDSTTTSTTIPSDESTTTSSSTSTTVSDISTTVSSTSSSTTTSSSSTTTSSTSTTSTSTIVETTTSTVMAVTSTAPTTIKPKADSGDGFSPKLFLLAILGIMLLLLLAILIVMMKKK